MLYSHVTLLMLRVVDVVAKTTVQQSARMLVADVPGDIQNFLSFEAGQVCICEHVPICHGEAASVALRAEEKKNIILRF
uniref:Secreted protein n=1 Tax=Parascaris univalens TaxID=6257 RepID=A0A915AJR3_PARUN